MSLPQAEYGIQRLTRWVSEPDMTRVPRKLRICSFERLIMPWRLPDWPCLILPEAVKRKRFLAPDFVFNLGFCVSFGAHALHPDRLRTASACPSAGRFLGSGRYTR